MLIITTIFLVPAETAIASFGNDYPWQAAQPTGEAYAWRMAGDGDIYSPLRFAYRNCTDWAAWRLNLARGGNANDPKFTWSSLAFANNDGNARGWRQGAINSGFTADNTPAVGAVAWWDGSVGGGYGHVAVVGEVRDGGNQIVLEDYNYRGTGEYQIRTVSRSSGWPQAFLHIADSTPAPPPRINRSIGPVTFQGTNQLLPGESMSAGYYLLSNDVRYALVLQSDGNLVLLGSGGQPLWNSETAGTGASQLVMQADGNLVLYTASKQAVWSTETPSWQNSSFIVQDDGNLVTYNSQQQPTWQSGGKSEADFSQAYTARLNPGQSLAPGQYIRSLDRRYALLLQGDGNLVLYGPAYHSLWATDSSESLADRLVMQTDGNLVLYRGSQAIWTTQTNGVPEAFLQLQDDGNLVIYSGSTSHWATHTTGQH